jgi:hypothetical protein
VDGSEGLREFKLYRGFETVVNGTERSTVLIKASPLLIIVDCFEFKLE